MALHSLQNALSRRLLTGVVLSLAGCQATPQTRETVPESRFVPPVVAAASPGFQVAQQQAAWHEQRGPTDRPGHDAVVYRGVTPQLPAGLRSNSATNLAATPLSDTRFVSHETADPPPQLLPNPAPVRVVDFATVLTQAAGQNPQVAFAASRVQEAYANWDRARILWLPSINAGANYNKHEGRIQDVVGHNIETSRGALYSGFGAQAVGAASPAVPGLVARFHLSDALHQPHIAGHVAQAGEFANATALHDALLAAALRYNDLLRTAQQVAVAEETLERSRQLTELTASFARAGQGSQADSDRARTEFELRKSDVERTREEHRVAAVRLAQVLSEDPTLPLVPSESNLVPIDLVPPSTPAGEAVATALGNRPELGEARSLVAAAVQRYHREKHAPLVPSVLLGLSHGGFGAGTGSDINHFGDRLDFDVAAWWELRNLGFGEAAARRQASWGIEQARWRQVETMDRVAAEAVEALIQVQQRRQRLELTRSAIRAAEDSYRRNFERIREGQGLPLEVLQSIQSLDTARREYLRVLADYNEAQFRLHRALGWPIGPKN